LGTQEGLVKKPVVLIAVVSICVLGSQNAWSQANLGLRSVGVQVGMVSPENSDATIGFGGLADLGTLAPNLRITSHLDFWSKSQDSPLGGSASVGDVTLSARGEYQFPVTNTRLQPFAGAGLAMHFLHAKVEVPGFLTAEDSSTKLGLDLGGGLAMPVSPRTEFRSEVWYGIVDNYSQLSLKAGLAFKIGS
jgi:opacity protein-like surface antigen